jgi:cytoskeletal protein RodZ
MSGTRRPATSKWSRPRLLLAALLALAAGVLLGSCGSAGKGLIPVAHAGPLLGDFEAVQQAAENGGGDCSATNAALAKTEEDFASLPSSVDRGLRRSLRQGIANLTDKAHELCSQPLTSTTHTTTTTKTTPTTTTKTTPTTPTTTTNTTPATPTSTTPPTGGGAPGGTQAPSEPSQGAGGAGEGGGEEGAGAQEGSK